MAKGAAPRGITTRGTPIRAYVPARHPSGCNALRGHPPPDLPTAEPPAYVRAASRWFTLRDECTGEELGTIAAHYAALLDVGLPSSRRW